MENKTIEVEIDGKIEKVVDREYYINKFIEKIKEDKGTMIFEMYKGCLAVVHNLPKCIESYIILDRDELNEKTDEEFADEIGDVIGKQ
jgi:hypothetical protein